MAKPKLGYQWHLRVLMANHDMFATSDLQPLLVSRGINLSAAQVYRLVAKTPERLSLPTLMALCDILNCTPNDLIEPTADVAAKRATGTGGAAKAPRGVAHGEQTSPTRDPAVSRLWAKQRDDAWDRRRIQSAFVFKLRVLSTQRDVRSLRSSSALRRPRFFGPTLVPHLSDRGQARARGWPGSSQNRHCGSGGRSTGH